MAAHARVPLHGPYPPRPCCSHVTGNHAGNITVTGDHAGKIRYAGHHAGDAAVTRNYAGNIIVTAVAVQLLSSSDCFWAPNAYNINNKQ